MISKHAFSIRFVQMGQDGQWCHDRQGRLSFRTEIYFDYFREGAKNQFFKNHKKDINKLGKIMVSKVA